jgi:hypothetical protein
MIDLTGPLTRARLAVLLGGRPFDLKRIRGVGVVLTIHHEHADVHVESPITAKDLDPVHGERLRSNLEAMVTALDKAAFPDRVTRFLAAVKEVPRLQCEPFGLHAWRL